LLKNWGQRKGRKRDVRRVKARTSGHNRPIGRKANFNRRKTKAKLGDHLIQCDITGQVCLRSEAKKTWDGKLVSIQNWDEKHPQLIIRTTPEDISVVDARPFKSSLDPNIPCVVLTSQTIIGI